jgi:hypothetical protein
LDPREAFYGTFYGVKAEQAVDHIGPLWKQSGKGRIVHQEFGSRSPTGVTCRKSGGRTARITPFY